MRALSPMLLAASFAVCAPWTPAVSQEDPLPRRAFLGVRLGAPMPGSAGVRIEGFAPGGSAEASGVLAGDLLVRLDGEPIRTGADLVRAMRGHRAGETVTLAVLREAQETRVRVELRPLPPETRPGQQVIYGSVLGPQGARLRTLVTRPEGIAEGQPRPAVFYLQGLGCASVEAVPQVPGDPVDAFISEMGKAGLVTLRVEKSGIGDSTGPPCPEIDLATELAGYQAALAALKRMPFVDPSRVVLFGHSAGGWMAPLVAAEDPVRGIVAYGTVSRTFLEYQLENTRRQLSLAGAAPADLQDGVRAGGRVFERIVRDGRTPRQVREESPELAATVDRMSGDGVHLYTRHPDYFRQLEDVNLARVWSGVDAHVLALWGTADFVASRADHPWIAEVVERARPGRGNFEEVPRADHGMLQAESQAAAFAAEDGPAAPPRTLSPDVVARTLAWIRRIAA
jgi:pimeloyl-ACP methyl ester carboxylesterase